MSTQIEDITAEVAARQVQSPAARSPHEKTLFAMLLLVALTLAAYEPVLHDGFVSYDDPMYVTANGHVQQGLTWSNVRWALTATEAANWHPLTWISHMADVQLFGLNPVGHHLVNLVLHLVNVILLFLLLRAATGYILRSAIVAALFAVFPLNAESVAWIAQRKTLLSTMFLLLTFFAYGWYARRPGIGRYLLTLLLFTLGLAAKPMVVTMPFLLLLADYWPLRRVDAPGTVGPQLAKLVMEKIPFFLLSVCSAIITMIAQKRGYAVGSTRVFPIYGRIDNAIYSYAKYIVKGIWPSHLAVYYPYPGNSLWKVAFSGLVLVAIAALVWLYRRKRYPLVGWLWYVIGLVPVIGLVQVGTAGMADRYAYTPFMGLFVMAVWLGADVAERIHLMRPAVAVLALATLGGYSWVSHVQAGFWRDNYALYSHAIQATNRNGLAEENLGVTLMSMGHPDLAMQHFEAAVQYEPGRSGSHYDLARLLQAQGNLGRAAIEYELAMYTAPDPKSAAMAHNNLGAIFYVLNQPETAKAEYTAAIQLDPNEVNSFLGRGSLEYREGQLEAAQRDFSRAVQIAPSPAGWFLLGQVLEDEGQLEAAAKAYESALSLAPDIAEAQTRLASLRTKLQHKPGPTVKRSPK